MQFFENWLLNLALIYAYIGQHFSLFFIYFSFHHSGVFRNILLINSQVYLTVEPVETIYAYESPWGGENFSAALQYKENSKPNLST